MLPPGVDHALEVLRARQILGNSLLRWVAAALGFVAGFIVLRWVRGFAFRRVQWLASRTKTDWDDYVAGLIAHIHNWFLLAIALWVALTAALALPHWLTTDLYRVVVVATFLQAALLTTQVLTRLLERRFGESDDPGTRSGAALLGIFARGGVWVVALLLVLDNVGVNVGTLVAGLGVGGVAIALATQNVLGDVFASVSILLDKPFVVGDFIILDNYMGVVERIGIKTTRVRSLDGELIVFANADLLKSRIRNYKSLGQRRVLFRVGVVYETPPEVLEKLPGILREAVTAQQGTRIDRAHFASYGDSALVFEVVYYVVSGDYNVYMDIQQAINLAIFRRFTEVGAAFAYPTQTLRIAEMPDRQ